MNAEVKKQWVDALRSGDYKQGRMNLRSGDQFCCLGVLCDLAVKAGVVQAVAVDEQHTGYGESESVALLPREVIEWAGMKDNAGYYDHDDAGVPQSSLTGLNDFRRFNFNQIADAIEENF